jgi:hypothetical protein
VVYAWEVCDLLLLAGLLRLIIDVMWRSAIRECLRAIVELRLTTHAVHHPDFWLMELLSRACCWLVAEAVTCSGDRGHGWLACGEV